MRGELREKFNEAIHDAFENGEDAVLEVVKDFIDEMETAFGEIKDNLDNDTLREINCVDDAYRKADDYSDTLF